MGLVKTLIGVLVDEVAGKDKGPPQPRESGTRSGAEETAADTRKVAQVPPTGGNPDVMPGAQGQSDPSACGDAVHPVVAGAPGAYPAQPVAVAPGAYPAHPVAVAPGAYPAHPVAAGSDVGYPPGTYPAAGYPPGTYPAAGYPPGTYPAAAYPPGTYPPAAYPPAAYPVAPGTYPYPAAGSQAQPAVYHPQPGGDAVYMSAGEMRRSEKERRKIEKKAGKERRKEDVESIVRGIKNIF